MVSEICQFFEKVKTIRRNYALAIIAIILFIIATIIGNSRGNDVYVTELQPARITGQGYVRIVFYKRDGVMEAYIHIQDVNGHQMIRQSQPIEVKNPVWIKWRK